MEKGIGYESVLALQRNVRMEELFLGFSIGDSRFSICGGYPRGRGAQERP